MRDRSTLEILGRRWKVIAATLVLFVVVAGIISKVLPKYYTATSTLIVVGNGNVATFDAVQAAEVTARSYSDIVSAPVIAGLAARRLGGGATTNSVSSAISVSPVAETQLLRISAQGRSPLFAQRLANSYASVVIEYAHRYLGSTAGASLSLASPATRPTSPSRPRPTLYVFIAAILGLFLGVGGAFLLERLDTRLRTVDEVRSRFKQVVLTRIPRRGTSSLSKNAFDEAFGLLRTNLQFASPSGLPKVIAVTSARGGEGKTTCVSAMAFAMAEAGLRVIVVDTDFRRSQLQAEVMPDRAEPLRPGLSSYLLDDAPLEEIVHDTGRPRVQIVPTGPLPTNPAAFLESHGVQAALRELAERSDIVLVDCPPTSAGADASIVAARVDGVIAVINLERSDERVVGELLGQLEIVHAHVLGFVLNEDRAADLTYDYEYAGQLSE
jgi:capsular exopolysaccharide synthesis family protein